MKRLRKRQDGLRRRLFGIAVFLGWLASDVGCGSSQAGGPRPNLVFILADDLGIGDVRCLNPRGRIPTPRLDALAREGVVFTDAHSGSSVCTPTRYGLLTGRYAWRSRLKSGVQGGMSPPLLEPGRMTVADLLKRGGYATACIGKWHLGMDWQRRPGMPPFTDAIERGTDAWQADFSRPVTDGPLQHGFDEFFGIAASLDMVPYAFIEDDRLRTPPSTDLAFPMFHGRTNRWTRRGPGAPGFEDVDVLPELIRRSCRFIERRSEEARAGRPFFLYLALTSPHTPISPSPEWRGRSGLNPYADFVMQTDAAVGEVLDAIDAAGLRESTLVMFASDNGCSPEADLPSLARAGHQPGGAYRGGKADLFEGGHRIPLLARWPRRIRAGVTHTALVCLNDLFATGAELLGVAIPGGAAEDSVSFLGALVGRTGWKGRRNLIHHSINGSFAIRDGRWKLALCADSGGWSAPVPGSASAKGLPAVQLYDLDDDPAETRNLALSRPGVASRLERELRRQIARGRSTPGPEAANSTPVSEPAR